MTKLGTAIQIAATVHEHQTDKGGNAYILHVTRVMMRLRTNDEDLMCIAVLHDTVEDGTITFADLQEKGFSDRVIAALKLLTHDPKVPYDDYIRLIATNRDATRVKLEDLRDNSDITRLKGLRKKDFDRLEKYSRSFVYLTKVINADSDLNG